MRMSKSKVADGGDVSLSAMYFVIADRQRNMFSYAWRIGWSGTSFYVKARYAPLSAFKISLHGPDPRPGMRPGFKIALDDGAAPGATAAGGAYCGSSVLEPQWFSGHKVKDGVTHVITFRTTWDLFIKGAPSAPGPGNIRSRTKGLVIPAPSALRAADLEIYVCDRRPFWKNESRARSDDACIGPIQNKAGQYLTGVSYRRSALNDDVPDAALALKAQSSDDRVRGIGTAADRKGVLWIVEHWMSASAMKEAVAEHKKMRAEQP